MKNKSVEIILPVGATDYLAVNSPRVARVMRGVKCVGKPQEFRSTTARLGIFWRLLGFMLRSVVVRLPGKKTTGDVVKFAQPSTVTVQAEGESQELKDVEKIEIRKTEQALKVVKF